MWDDSTQNEHRKETMDLQELTTAQNSRTPVIFLPPKSGILDFL